MEKVLSKLHEIQESRDASASIRGFLFQDLIAIEELLKEETEYIISEWVEDVISVTADKVNIIQAKYYPNSSLNYREIYRELFCDYIIVDCKKRLVYPIISTHSNVVSVKHEKTKVEDYIKDIGNDTTTEFNEVLEELGQIKGKKYQEAFILKKLSSKEKFNDFYEKMKVENKPNLLKYNKKLTDDILKTYNIEDKYRNAILGIAISYIKEAYHDENRNLDKRKRTKKEFDNRFKRINSFSKEQLIKKLVIGCVYECFSDVCNEFYEKNKAQDKGLEEYKKIYLSTIEYLESLLENIEGRFKFLNTISKFNHENLNKEYYENEEQHKGYEMYLKSFDNINCYIKIIWKILFNISEENFSHCVDNNFSDFIIFNFPEEIKSIIVLGEVTNSNTKKEIKSIFSRIISQERRPKKWYVKIKKKQSGLKDYSWKVNEIFDSECKIDVKNTIESEKFYIECLSCIETDEEMTERENCSECIFNDVCKDNNCNKEII